MKEKYSKNLSQSVFLNIPVNISQTHYKCEQKYTKSQFKCSG